MFDWSPVYWWTAYFWPSDKGNGPEAIQQILLGVAVVSLLYPPLRAAWKHETERLHAKMDHIIKHHPDIPDFKP